MKASRVALVLLSVAATLAGLVVFLNEGYAAVHSEDWLAAGNGLIGCGIVFAVLSLHFKK